MSGTDLSSIGELRAQWRDVRAMRLQRKKTLLTDGYTQQQIRRDTQCRNLLKEQRKLATTLRHKNAFKSRTISKQPAVKK
ncbi:MAG TPA: hypothetical protein VF857_01750 [Spirochaetota bacterium]